MDAEMKAQFESVIPRREMGRPEEIASAALFLASDTRATSMAWSWLSTRHHSHLSATRQPITPARPSRSTNPHTTKSTHHDHHQHYRLGQHGDRHRHPSGEARPHHRVHEPQHRKAQALADQIGKGATVGTFGQGQRATSSSSPSCIPARLKWSRTTAMRWQARSSSTSQPVQRRRHRTRDYRGQLDVPADCRPPRGHTPREGIQYDLRRRPCSRQASGRVLRRRQRRGEGTRRGVSGELGHAALDAGGLEMAWVLNGPASYWWPGT